jgi:hypothetical protein
MAQKNFWDIKMPLATYEHSQMQGDPQHPTCKSFDLLQRHGFGDDDRIDRGGNDTGTSEGDNARDTGFRDSKFDLQLVLVLHVNTCAPSNQYMEGPNVHSVFGVRPYESDLIPNRVTRDLDCVELI